MQKLVDTLYRGSRRIVPSDITHLLVREISAPVSFEESSHFHFTEMIVDQLEEIVPNQSLQLGQTLIDDMQESGFRFYAALVEDQIAGYLLVGKGQIAARHNCAGAPFAGAGLKLPGAAAYVFKCFVVPSKRGQKILSRLLDYVAVQQYTQEAVTHLVTTTDWTNHAALGSFRKAGFERVGMVAEFVLAGRHFYKLPAAVGLGTKDKTTNVNGTDADIENSDTDNSVVVFRGD